MFSSPEVSKSVFNNEFDTSGQSPPLPPSRSMSPMSSSVPNIRKGTGIHWEMMNSSIYSISSDPFVEELSKVASGDNLVNSTTDMGALGLYDMILALNSDCGFDSFFKNLITILETNFGAERVSISLPTDPSDIVNIPWGLKALWSKEKPLPLTPQFSSSSRSTLSDKLPGNGIHNDRTKRSSDGYDNDSNWDTDVEADTDTAIELHEDMGLSEDGATPKPAHTTSFRRKFGLTRKLSKRLGRSEEGVIPRRHSPVQVKESNASSPRKANGGYRQPFIGNPNMLIFEQLRTLEWEDDPLIDAQGILNVLEQDRLVLLQRKYLTGDQTGDQTMANNLDSTPKYTTYYKNSSESSMRHKAFNHMHFFDSEQAVESPWSKSPAPSPAVREYKESPFVKIPANTMESAFEETESDDLADSKTLSRPVGAIGYEDTYSILHLLVVVPGSSAGTSRSAPIGIISVMSSLIPFPSKLREVLDKFTPHIATSFLQARAHSTLTSQLTLAKHPSPMMRRGRSGSNVFAPPPFHEAVSPSSPQYPKFKLDPPLRVGSNTLEAQKRFYTSLREDKIEDPTTSRSLEILANEELAVGALSPRSDCFWSPAPPINRTASSQHYAFPRFGSRRSRVRPQIRKLLYSYGASLVNEPERAPKSPERPTQPRRHSNERRASSLSAGFSMAVPSNRLLRTIIDAIPVHVFTAEPVEGEITWVSNRTLAFRGQTAEEFCRSPVSSLHPDDQIGYLEAWNEALRTGVPLGRMCKVRRFDNSYRSFFMRAVPLRDEKGAIIHWFCTMMDIHNQHQSELESIQLACETAGEQKYKTLAESSPIIVFSTSPKEGMQYANNKWFDYSGLTPAETYGFHYMDAIHPDDREKSKLPIKLSGEFDKSCFVESKYRDGTYSVELRLRNAEGEYRWHLAMFTCSDLENPAQSVWFGTCTDIHDQKLIQEKLKIAKDTAQRTIESKTRFLSNMSHEIRTPLIGISGMVGFLLDTPLTEEQLDYCHTISSSSEALLMVINDILDLSKVESGKMTLTYSWFYVRRLVEEVNELLSSMAIAKNLELNYIIDSKVSPWIKGDRVRLRQVMLNLIGNAIKFTDTGEIFTYCTIDQSKSSNDAMTLLFEVHDTGRGFTLEDSQRMFKPFSQVHGYASSSSSGTGLGLVISRQLIELHKGELTGEGVKDKGSTFKFTCEVQLPTDDDKPSQQQITKELGGYHGDGVAKQSLSNPMNILIICPWKYTGQSIEHHIRATVLNPENCNILRVSAIEEMETVAKPQVLWSHVVINLTDLERLIGFFMRGPSSFAGVCKSTQFIVLTSPTQKSTIHSQISKIAGPDYKITFLAKPLKSSSYSIVFDPSEEREQSYDVKMRSAQQTLQNQKSVFSGLRSFAESDSYRVLLAEDNLVNQKVISKFLTRAGFECDIATDGEVCTSKVFRKGYGYYNLILCDLDMPRKNGFEACVDIRTWEIENEYAPIPIVALSAYVMSDVSAKCDEVGFTKYISKPVEFSNLKDPFQKGRCELTGTISSTYLLIEKVSLLDKSENSRLNSTTDNGYIDAIVGSVVLSRE